MVALLLAGIHFLPKIITILDPHKIILTLDYGSDATKFGTCMLFTGLGLRELLPQCTKKKNGHWRKYFLGLVWQSVIFVTMFLYFVATRDRVFFDTDCFEVFQQSVFLLQLQLLFVWRQFSCVLNGERANINHSLFGRQNWTRYRLFVDFGICPERVKVFVCENVSSKTSRQFVIKRTSHYKRKRRRVRTSMTSHYTLTGTVTILRFTVILLNYT